jgi:hemerythrin-like domain-containing protein
MKFIGISDGVSHDVHTPESPVEMLLGCHSRIRHFIQLSRTLADAEGMPLLEIGDAALAVYRYFSLALPLHEADEDETLFPRLRDALPEGGLLYEAAVTMVEQHKAIDELADELLILCSALGQQPERLPSLASRLGHVSWALGEIFTVHLQLEETVIFPAIQELMTQEQLEEISREMHHRRQSPRGVIHLVQ